MNNPTVNIIGSGFAGLAAAASLAQKGIDVTVFEKNPTIGGRARQFSEKGFTFDMGPSWYWMPDVFEVFFNRFGKTASDFYDLRKLDPGFTIFFEGEERMDVPAELEGIYEMFENLEKGSADKLKKFLDEGAYKYEVGVKDLVYRPNLSFTEILDPRLALASLKLDVFKPFDKYVRKYFKHPHLVKLMEFPVLFLGAMPADTPALYSLMNYSALADGTWYPIGGMHEIVKAMEAIAREQGVKFQTKAEVEQIVVKNRKATHLQIGENQFEADITLAAADYHHVDQSLLEKQHQHYDEKYWDKRTLAPSSLIFYLGVNQTIPKLNHHNLFFDTDFDAHARAIYKNPSYPDDPLFYVCCPSKTDDSVAPQGSENIFILIPIAVDLEDNETLRQKYFEKVMNRLEKTTGMDIRAHIVYQKSFSVRDFKKEYHSYKGNAYGLANTLFQTAIFKPKMKSKKVDQLYYAGQLTTPGPGVPPSLISGMVAADLIGQREFGIAKNFKKKMEVEIK
ncbi:MAG: phytoene desaturase family protein [Bacteroidota bacterium]